MTTRFWIGLGFLVLLAAALASCGVQSARLKQAKADQHNPATHRLWRDEAKEAQAALVVARRDLGQCQSNRAGLQTSLNAQSAAVQRWKGEAEAARLAADQALAQARTASAAANRKATAVLTARPTADLCRSTDELILESLR